MTTLRSSSFLRLFVLPFVLSFWVSACSSSSWRPIQASPLTADAVADADSVRVLTAHRQRLILLYPEITVLADSLIGSSDPEGWVRTAIPLDSIQRTEEIWQDSGTKMLLPILGIASFVSILWGLSELNDSFGQ